MITNILLSHLFALSSASASPLDCGGGVHWAGAIATGQVVHSDLSCRNRGETEITIGDIETGCPCLTVLPDRSTVAPGASVKFKVSLDTRDLLDAVQFTVNLSTQASVQSAGQFSVSANVRPRLVAIPEYVDLGDFRRQAAKTVLLVDTTGASFSVRSVSSSRGLVDLHWEPVELIRIGQTWEVSRGKGAVHGIQLRVQAKPGADAKKSISDEVTLEMQHELQKQVRLRVVGYSQ